MPYKVYQIPSGPKNLASLFPVDWNEVKEYYIEVFDEFGSIVGTTNLFKIGCCCREDKIRIVFLNYLGTWDAVNFNKPTIAHESTDSTFQSSPNYPLLKSDIGIGRFNVRSNDTYEASTICYKEKDMAWLQELQDSPVAFLEWKGSEGQPDDYLAIWIQNVKMEKQKKLDDWIYTTTVQFKLSNEFYSIRN